MGAVDAQVANEEPLRRHLERFDPREQGGHLIDLEHRGRYWWAARIAEGKDVLDAGCGTGYGAQILNSAGAATVSAVDVSAEAVEATEVRLSPGAALLADLHDLPLADDSFDLVVCFEVIEHLAEAEPAIGELRRVLRPDGILLLSSPNPDVYPQGNEHHMHEYRPGELAALVGERFANTLAYRQHAWLASAIESAQVPHGDGEDGERLRPTRAIESLVADGETYALIAASDTSIPDLPGLVTLGSAFEVRWWQDEVVSAKKHVARSEASADELRAQLREATEGLLDANQALAQIPALTHRLEEMHRIITVMDQAITERDQAITDVEGSISWRLTAPLRRLRRFMRAAGTD